MKFRNFTLLFFIPVLAIAACSKSSNPTPTTKPKKDTTITSVTPVWQSDADVYFVGTTRPGNTTLATMWKNGVVTVLPNNLSTSDSEADAVAAQGSDVYIAGKTHIGNVDVATMWKNGVATKLASTSVQSQANAITINGTDVYLAGVIDGKAVSWKNGVATAVFNPDSVLTIATIANAITVSGTDIYMAGYSIGVHGGYMTPIIWKNGIATKLIQNSLSPGQEATGIAISGNDVYVVGNTISGATIWKNGTATLLGNGGTGYTNFASAIIIQGSDVYVAGNIGETPTVWKNGVATILPSTQPINTEKIGFAIDGNDAYIANGINANLNVSLYWRDGIAYPYYTGISLIYGIAIAPH